jgi:hypothetical protein
MKTFFEIFFIIAVARKRFLHKDQFFVAALVQIPQAFLAREEDADGRGILLMLVSSHLLR